MAELKGVVAQYQDLSKEWAKGASRDLAKVGNQLEQLKLSLMKLSFLPTKGEDATIQVVVSFFSKVKILLCSWLKIKNSENKIYIKKKYFDLWS